MKVRIAIRRGLQIVLLLLLLGHTASAQHGHHGRPFERIHAIKVAFITDRLQLSTEESAGFWPVYNRYEDEKWDLRRAFFKKHRKAGDISMEHSDPMRYIDDDLDYREQELALKRRYKEKFLKILSPAQLAELYKAEHDFKVLLIKQLDKRRGRD